MRGSNWWPKLLSLNLSRSIRFSLWDGKVLTWKEFTIRQFIFYWQLFAHHFRPSQSAQCCMPCKAHQWRLEDSWVRLGFLCVWVAQSARGKLAAMVRSISEVWGLLASSDHWYHLRLPATVLPLSLFCPASYWPAGCWAAGCWAARCWAAGLSG